MSRGFTQKTRRGVALETCGMVLIVVVSRLRSSQPGLFFPGRWKGSGIHILVSKGAKSIYNSFWWFPRCSKVLFFFF